MVRLHSSALPGDEALVAERLACTEEERVRLPPSPLAHASVVSTASTRPLYGRGAGSSPDGGFSVLQQGVRKEGSSCRTSSRSACWDRWRWAQPGARSRS